MRFDDVLEEIGGFGPYQKWVFLLTCFTNLLSGVFMINPVFLLAVPLHRCAIPGYVNDTYVIQNGYHELLVKQTIPPSSTDKEAYDSCNVYIPADSTLPINTTTPTIQIRYTNATEKCSSWVYDKDVFENTFVSQVDLVCDKELWVANAEMLFYGGVMVGSFLCGLLADKYGRKIVMYVSSLMLLGSAVGLSFADSYPLFVVLEFILGASVISTYTPAYIISLEITSAKKRVWPGVISNFPYVFGLILLSAIAYGLRDWMRIELYTALPGVLFILYWWLMPESPRWLLTKGRIKEAEAIVRKAAKWNNVSLPEKLFDKSSVDTDDQGGGSFFGLFTSKTLLCRTLLIFFNWTVVAFAYFGLALNTDNLEGDLYLNFGISGAVEIPAYLIVTFLVDKVGRRRLYCGAMLIGGIACASTWLTIEYGSDDLESLTVALAMVGKMCVTAGYGVQYVHSAELFPTVARNAGLGAASLFAGIGTMVAPYIVTLGEDMGSSIGKALPLIVFGVMSFVSGILSLLLPETLNRRLPETLADGEQFGRSGAFYFVRSLRLHDSYERMQVDESENELVQSTEKQPLITS